MDIGLNINEGIKITIGETYDNIIRRLEDAGVAYKKPFEKKNILSSNKNEQSIIIFLEKSGVELNVLDNRVIYIKSTDYSSNIVVRLDDDNISPVSILHNIIKRLSEIIKVSEYNIHVESFDTLSFNAVFKVKTLTDDVKISVMCTDKNIYLYTVRLSQKRV